MPYTTDKFSFIRAKKPDGNNMIVTLLETKIIVIIKVVVTPFWVTMLLFVRRVVVTKRGTLHCGGLQKKEGQLRD
jgi:hypothetical protein